MSTKSTVFYREILERCFNPTRFRARWDILILKYKIVKDQISDHIIRYITTPRWSSMATLDH